ncbi:hypothetical protein [Paraburkholderia elongata]|uniref:Uncharacterized protein n=1 Tax=Paraburkholderia elongata TaxID=2675747 RepID=A0A972NW39_9BURK|nr:hypothetical protein [Paraburkholderia elongata]NPT59694.1 hypothetical protein [Paraburkholderia elongata]
MNLIISMFHRSDLSRSRAMVQELAEESIKARRNLDETERKAARALEDAKRLDEADFRMKFEKRLTPQSAFLPSAVPAGMPPTPFDAWEFTRMPTASPSIGSAT